MTELFDTLADFAPPEQPELNLFLARSAEEDPTAALESAFDDVSIEFAEATVPELERDTLVLFNEDELVASSPVSELVDTVERVTEMVRTGGVDSLESVGLPSVLEELAETTFGVRESTRTHPELLFIAISRHIEARAYEQGSGTLRAGFQRLSRLGKSGETHTRAVYERIAALDVDVHVYGIPDWIPPESFPVTVHAGHGEDFARNWFVVYRSEGVTAAFLAHEHDAGWRGHWTFDADRVDQILRYLERRM